MVDVARDESEEERDDRNLAELLQELRVAGLGVQVLFGFLLSLPFTNRFTHLSPGQRNLYLGTIVLAAVATALLLGPVAYHRLVFRQGQKERLVRAANIMAIAGLATVGLAVSAAVLLVTDYVSSGLTAGLITAFVTMRVRRAVVRASRWRTGADLYGADLTSDCFGAGLRCLKEDLGQARRQRHRLVQPGQPEQPPDLTPAADHAQAAPVRGRVPGRAGQRAEPGRVDEAHPVQVGHQRAAGRRQRDEPLAQPGRGGKVNLPGHGDEHVSRFVPDQDGQFVVLVRALARGQH